jgi:hypothetical protein
MVYASRPDPCPSCSAVTCTTLVRGPASLAERVATLMGYNKFVMIVLAVFTTACGPKPTELACPLVLYSALLVTARDSTTGTLVPGAILESTVPYRDSVSVGSNVALYPVALAPAVGTYLVTVQAPGYVGWSRTETVTSTDRTGCSIPDQVSVTALLQEDP